MCYFCGCEHESAWWCCAHYYAGGVEASDEEGVYILLIKWMHTPFLTKLNAKRRNRTADTSIFSAVLYRLSYLGMSLFGTWHTIACLF